VIDHITRTVKGLGVSRAHLEAWESNRLLAATPSPGFAGYSPDFAVDFAGESPSPRNHGRYHQGRWRCVDSS